MRISVPSARALDRLSSINSAGQYASRPRQTISSSTSAQGPLSLYTGRTASAYNFQTTEDDFWNYARGIHATYLITTNAFNEDHGFLTQFAEKHPSSLELIYENSSFRLYRIQADPALQTVATYR